MRPTDGFWSRRKAAEWFRCVARRPELRDLPQEARDAVAAEVVAGLARGVSGRLLFNEVLTILCLLGFIAGMSGTIVLGLGFARWMESYFWVAALGGAILLLAVLLMAEKRLRVRRLVEGALARREGGPGDHPAAGAVPEPAWLDLARDYRAVLVGRGREISYRALAARWAQGLRELPQVANVPFEDRDRLSEEAAEKALRDPLVRPARCFDCRADLTASAGPACPRCGARLLRDGERGA
ncbi:MAG: hypothetical protein HY721_04720 [Planctomycetes bacterium]|nr:hypothetical protein [Planctomycetota bacterium]